MLVRPPFFKGFVQKSPLPRHASRSKPEFSVGMFLLVHPRFELLYLPTSCPRANLIERAFGDVHDKCTRNHTRKRMWHLV